MPDSPQEPIRVPALNTYLLSDAVLHAEHHRKLGFPFGSVLDHDSFHAAFDGAADLQGQIVLDHVHGEAGR